MDGRPETTTDIVELLNAENYPPGPPQHVLRKAVIEIERLREVRRASSEFVRFVQNNLPNLEPREVSCLFGHLEWDELRAALKETE